MERQTIVESRRQSPKLKRTSALIVLGTLALSSPILAVIEIRKKAICSALAQGEMVLDQPDFTVDTSLAEIQETCRVRRSNITPECFAQAIRNTPSDSVMIPPHLRLFGDTPHSGSCIPPPRK